VPFDSGGLAIYYKRLECGTFQFPSSHRKSLAISSAELVRLLAGCRVEYAVE
jgi:hypothetical protein